jgi:UPF0042 nucleotide-binding protein
MPVAILVLTGQSGSGKSIVMRALEDKGYYCVDNMPATVVEQVVSTIVEDKISSQIAIAMDVRTPNFSEDGLRVVKELKARYDSTRLLYLEATEEYLQRRYSETRRIHPRETGEGLLAAISDERDILVPFRECADDTIDTSGMSPHDLRSRIHGQFADVNISDELRIAFVSFGFKYGAPQVADIVLDVRFLPNPYFIPEMRRKTGLNDEVRDYVLSFDKTTTFLRHATEMLSFLIPEYRREGKRYLTVAIGCTGGQHRSVSIVRELTQHFKKNHVLTDSRHRDVKE